MKFTGERMIPGTEECSSKSSIFKEHVERYKFASRFVKDKVVLDIACGAGYGSKMLLNRGAKKIFGGDISKETINYCKTKYPNKELSFSVMDAQKLPFKDKYFDVVVSFETIEHVDSPELIIKDVSRILKPNGVFIVSTPNVMNYYSGNRFHKKELTPKEFRDVLEENFEKVEMYGQRTKNNALITLLKERLSITDPKMYKLSDIKNPIFLIAVCKK